MLPKLLILAALAVFVNGYVRISYHNGKQGLVSFYNCTGKSDGGHSHPTDCTKFIFCLAGTYAFEMDCPDCIKDAVYCPEGKLHYNSTSKNCDWVPNAGCSISPPPPPTQTVPPPPPTEIVPPSFRTHYIY